jgi:hypothetical protein
MSCKEVSDALKAVFKAKDRAAHSSVADPSLNTDFQDAQAAIASSPTNQHDFITQLGGYERQ